MEGAFDGRVLTSQHVRHRKQVGDSGALRFREVDASTGDLSQMDDALKRDTSKKGLKGLTSTSSTVLQAIVRSWR